MRLLSLDPSSTRTGWALLVADDGLADCGLIMPERSSDPAPDRIDHMVTCVQELVRTLQPTHAVVESPSGKVSQRSAKSMGRGLAVYGEAVGAIRTAVRLMGIPVDRVDERMWTKRGGRHLSKDARAAQIEMQFSAYDRSADSGLDTADAIGLGQWWFINQRMEAT